MIEDVLGAVLLFAFMFAAPWAWYIFTGTPMQF